MPGPGCHQVFGATPSAADTRARGAALLRLLLLLLLSGSMPTACTTGGTEPLRIHSLRSDRAGTLAIPVGTARFHADGPNEAIFVIGGTPLPLTDGTAGLDGTTAPADDGDIHQTLTIHLLWVPRRGATLGGPDATNARLRHAVRVGTAEGTYEGAGFARVSGSLLAETITVTLLDSTLRLVAATESFEDPLSPLRIVGSFRATRVERESDLRREPPTRAGAQASR